MIYIARHGQTDLNLQGRTQGRKGLPLNTNGLAQAKELKQKLKDIHFNFVYSSPQERAIQTAEIATGIKPIIDNRIDVFDIGTADNLKKSEIKMIGPLPDTSIYHGIENPKEYVKRVFSFMNELKQKHKNVEINIFICGHKDTTGCIGAFFKGMPADGNFMCFALSNGEMAIYNFE